MQLIDPIKISREEALDGKTEKQTLYGLTDDHRIVSVKLKNKQTQFEYNNELNQQDQNYLWLGSAFEMNNETIMPVVSKLKGIVGYLGRSDIGFINVNQGEESTFTKLSSLGHNKDVKKIAHLQAEKQHFIVSSSTTPTIKFTPIKYGPITNKDIYKWNDCFLIDIINQNTIVYFKVVSKQFFSGISKMVIKTKTISSETDLKKKENDNPEEANSTEIPFLGKWHTITIHASNIKNCIKKLTALFLNKQDALKNSSFIYLFSDKVIFNTHVSDEINSPFFKSSELLMHYTFDHSNNLTKTGRDLLIPKDITSNDEYNNFEGPFAVDQNNNFVYPLLTDKSNTEMIKPIDLP